MTLPNTYRQEGVSKSGFGNTQACSLFLLPSFAAGRFLSDIRNLIHSKRAIIVCSSTSTSLFVNITKHRPMTQCNVLKILISNKRGDRRYTREPIPTFTISVAVINHSKTFLQLHKGRVEGNITNLVNMEENNSYDLHLVAFQGHRWHDQRTMTTFSLLLRPSQSLEPKRTENANKLR